MEYREAIRKALKELIDTKHLYQSVTVDFEPCITQLAREQLARRRTMGSDASPDETEEEVKQQLLSDLDAKEWWYGVRGFCEF